MIETIRQGLQADGITVSIAKLCRWFNVPRRTVYDKPVKASPKLDPQFVASIKALIEGFRGMAVTDNVAGEFRRLLAEKLDDRSHTEFDLGGILDYVEHGVVSTI